MRDNISENWCKQLVGPGGQRDQKGGQGVRREVESERHEEKDRAVIKEATPDLDRLTNTLDTAAASFSSEMWKSTYNGDDLKPDVVSKELNDMYTKSDTEDRWKYNICIDWWKGRPI